MQLILRKLTCSGLASLPIALFAGVMSEAGTIYPDLPDMIKCELTEVASRPGGEVLLYLSGTVDGGLVVYHSIGRLNVGIVYDADGNPIGGSKALCGGQSLDEMTADGMTFNFGD